MQECIIAGCRRAFHAFKEQLAAGYRKVAVRGRLVTNR